MRILCLNAGSSSLKAAAFTIDDPSTGPGTGGPVDPVRAVAVLVERVGGDSATVTVTTADRPDSPAGPTPVAAPDHVAALGAVAGALDTVGFGPVDVVAHRLVHGGPGLVDHVLVDAAVRARLEAAVPFAPLHLPAELALLEASEAHFADRPQIACLDTAFHRGLAAESRRLPIPADLDAGGVRRYGFHGLSYEYLVHRLGPALGRRAVLAHLGNGASLAAVLDGAGIDTTMGFTPTGGLVMGSRTGDLDPGVLLHVLRTQALGVDELEHLVDRRSGLVGLSGRSGDVRDLLAARAGGDAAARLALAVYVASAAKHLAALTTMLGGLDTVVFTAGVGEHAAPVRAEIAGRLGHLGVAVDGDANAGVAGAAVISPPGAPVTVRVEPTDEESMMARHAARLAPRP